jgi:hypothetical protein
MVIPTSALDHMMKVLELTRGLSDHMI